MSNETATATTQTEATASSGTATSESGSSATSGTEASATLLATAGEGAGTTQQTQTAETQTATTAETTTEGAKGTATTTTKAPESYTFTAPEGKEYDADLLAAFSGAAKEADLTQEAAQKLIDVMAPAMEARGRTQIEAIHNGWREQAAADTEIGGAAMKENLAVARKALDTFGSPELLKLLNDTGLGSHPEVLRMLYRTGKAISEEKFVGGRATTTQVKPEAVLYDKTEKKG